MASNLPSLFSCMRTSRLKKVESGGGCTRIRKYVEMLRNLTTNRNINTCPRPKFAQSIFVLLGVCSPRILWSLFWCLFRSLAQQCRPFRKNIQRRLTKAIISWNSHFPSIALIPTAKGILPVQIQLLDRNMRFIFSLFRMPPSYVSQSSFYWGDILPAFVKTPVSQSPAGYHQRVSATVFQWLHKRHWFGLPFISTSQNRSWVQ